MEKQDKRPKRGDEENKNLETLKNLINKKLEYPFRNILIKILILLKNKLVCLRNIRNFDKHLLRE